MTSVETLGAPPGATGGPLDVNGGDLEKLYNGFKTVLDDGQAKFIVVYRQYGNAGGQNGGQPGGQPGQQPGQGGRPMGASGAQAPAAANAVQSVAPTAGGPGARPPGGAGGAASAPVSADSVQLNFQQQGGAQINSLLDLVGAQVQIPGADPNAQPQTVDSPWQDSPSGYRDLVKLYDAAVAGGAGRVAGRVNLNAASRPVLRSIPGLSTSAINQIIARRELEPDKAVSPQRHAIWLLVEGMVTLEEMRRLERYVTAGGDAFSGQTVGFFDAGPTAAHGEFVLERSSTTPRLRAWRDLASWGPGFSPEVLGAGRRRPLTPISSTMAGLASAFSPTRFM